MDVPVRAIDGFHDGGTRMHKNESGLMPQARAQDLARAGLVSIGPQHTAKQAPAPANKALPEPAAPSGSPPPGGAAAAPAGAAPGTTARPAPRSTKAGRKA